MLSWLQRLFSGPVRTAEPPAPAAVARRADAPAPAPAAARTSALHANPVAAPAGMPSFEQLDHVNNAWDAWLFGREAGAGLDTNPLEDQVLEALDAIAASQQSGAMLVRRMPGLIPQLLQSLRSEQFSGAALSRTISSDVVLVAEVIRLANGACQGAGITSVEHAVILIGQEGLRQLITSVAFRPIIDIHSGACTRTLAPRLWEHAERCAVACRARAQAAGVDPFEAFLAGLVHNVGLIVALRVMDQVAKDGRGLGSEVFCAHLARTARALTGGIGREWDFAPAVTQALADQGGVGRGMRPSPLGRLLTLCDYLCKVQALVEAGLLEQDDPALFAGLQVR